MYIKVRFETSGEETFTYILPEEYEDEIDLYDEVLVNAKGFLRLAQVVEIYCGKPPFPCRTVSTHLPQNIINELLLIGERFTT